MVAKLATWGFIARGNILCEVHFAESNSFPSPKLEQVDISKKPT